MEQLGTDFNATGSVMNRRDLEDLRKKRGECTTCGRKCFRKKLFKMIPIDEHGLVKNGRCLQCRPLDAKEMQQEGLPAVSRPATREDLARFTRSQSGLLGMRRQASDAPSLSSASSASSRPRMGNRAVSMNHNRGGPSSLATPPPISSRSLGPRSASVSPAISASVQPVEPVRPKTSVISTASSNSESQAIPLPPPVESPYLGRPTSSTPPPSGDGVNQSAAVVPAQERRKLPRFGLGSSRRRLTPTRSGQSLGSMGSAASNNSAPRSAIAPTGTISVNKNNVRSSPGARTPPMVAEERIPTAEDVEKAAQTILAAQKYGYHEDVLHEEDYGDIRQYPGVQDDYDDHHDDFVREIDANRGGHISDGSLRSGSSLGDHDVDDEDNLDDFVLPRHGVLNRGGEYAFHGTNNGEPSRPVGTHIVSGSSRTLSSMSSMEDDHHLHSHMNGHLGRTPSSKRLGPNTVDALYEEVDEASNSLHSSRASGSQSNSEQFTEQRYLERLRQAGADYSEILLILREAISSPLVIKEGLEELSCLQLTAEDQDVLADMGAHHVIADVMQTHGDIMEVQLWGCGAIWNLSGTLRNQISFVDAGALDLILTAMDNFIENVDIQEKAMATLSNLGAAEGNLSILVDQGAVKRIVDAMNKHSEVGSVQIRGCSAVTNLASHVSPLKEKIMDLGGGGAVVISMVLHPNDFYLQEKALRALRNLCANHEHNKVELANIGGIDAVISAMQVHRDEAGVQEEGAWTLSNLAGNDENKAVIGDCGGIDVIIRAMWVHSDNVGVQEWCCRALFTLTLDHQNGNVVLEVGGISAVVNAMQAHVDSPAVQEMGCAVLGNLAATNNSKMRIVEEEALDAIVLAMVLYSEDSQVQERACMVLLRLAIVENFKSMQAANIGELVRVAAEKFPSKCGEPARRLLDALQRF